MRWRGAPGYAEWRGDYRMSYVLTLLLLCGVVIPASNLRASLDVSEETVEMGKVERGQQARHSVHLANSGAEVVNIQRVEADCECTTATVSSFLIFPAEAAELNIVFDSKGESVGTFKKEISIYTGSPKPEKIIRVTGEVIAPASGTPK